MAIDVRIPTILRTYTDGAKAVTADGSTLSALQKDPLIGRIPAVGKGAVAVLADATPLAASANPTPLSTAPSSLENQLGGAFGDGVDGGIGIARRNGRHHRGVSDPDSLDPAQPQVRSDHGVRPVTHRQGSDRVAVGRHRGASVAAQLRLAADSRPGSDLGVAPPVERRRLADAPRQSQTGNHSVESRVIPPPGLPVASKTSRAPEPDTLHATYKKRPSASLMALTACKQAPFCASGVESKSTVPSALAA